MQEQYGAPLIRKREYTHFYTYFLMVYFLLAPFEDILTSDIGTLGKYLALLIVVVGIFESSGRIKFSFKEGNLALMYLMVLGLVSCVWAMYPSVSLSRNSAYLMLPGFYLFVSSLEFSEKEYEKIVHAAVLGGVLVAGYILINGYIARSGRVHLDEGNDPNNLAALLQLPLAMSFRMAMKKQTRFKALYIVIVVLLVFVLLLTGSRGGMFSTAVFFLAFFLFSKAYKKAGLLVGIAAVAIVVWQFVLPALPEEISARLFETDYGAEMDNGSRTSIWRIVLRGLLPKMAAYGVGAGCAPYALMEWFRRVKGVHNTYLCMLCEYGVLGLPFFLGFLWIKLRKQIKMSHYTEASLMLCIFVTIFFLDSYAKKFFWNVMMLAAIADKAGENQTAICSAEPSAVAGDCVEPTDENVV